MAKATIKGTCYFKATLSNGYSVAPKFFFWPKSVGHHEDTMRKTVTIRALVQIKEFWDMDPPHRKAELYYRGKLLKVFGGYDDLRLTTRAGNWALREGFTHIKWA